MKKILFMLVTFLIYQSVYASSIPLVEIGGKTYDSLEDAVNAVNSNETIKLISDIELNNTLEINKHVNINLNGSDISSREKVFLVKDGFLNISGSGIIRETSPNYGAVMLVGSNNPVDENYSGVKVGKDVTLEGWSGIFINHESSKSYGVVAYLEGKINAVNDISGGTGIGIYVNGSIKDKANHPVVNIMDGAEIKSTGTGLYIAGYSTFNIGDAYIEGVANAIGIKSGKLVIDGATVICNGENKTPTEGYNNGIKASGVTIQIESNNGYAGNMEIDISRGKFVSKNSNVIYEYIGRGSDSLIYSMSISGGEFISEKNKEVFSFSNSFKNIHSGFISGGEYSSNPSSYLKGGYSVVKDDMYNVVKDTLKVVNSNDIKINNNGFIKSIITLLLIMVTSIIIYFKKKR